MSPKIVFKNERYDFPCTPDCPERCADPNCHDTCERYLKIRRKRDQENAARLAKHERKSYTIDAVHDRRDRRAKARKNRPRNRYHTH